jgi:uncharacterized protein with HEPN domain
MNPEVKKLIQDIFDSIVIVEAHLQNVPGLSVYKEDIKTVDAVERRLAIIGEALWKADKKDKTINISNKARIISLRHILVHDYDLIEDATIWIICKKNIPILKNEVQSILGIV